MEVSMKNFNRLALVAIVLSPFAQGADLSSELMFPLQEKHVHGSTIVECPNGDLLAAWFQGSGERSADDVVINGARLRKGQSEWSPVFLMADTPDIPDCNPVLFIDARERLWLFWSIAHTNRWERVILKYRRAEEYEGEGAPVWSWQDIILLKPGKAFQDAQREAFDQLDVPAEDMWAEYAKPYREMLIEAAEDPIKLQAGWMTRTRPLQLASGRMLLPLYSDGFNAGLMALSDDDGATWRASKPIIGLGPIQPTLALRKNGEIVAYCRDSGTDPKRVMESVSSDNGESWSIGRDTELPNPGSSLALINLADGRWALVYNDTEQGRHQLAVALSSDEGKTWPHKRYLEKENEGGFSYPSAIQSRDGRIHVSYSYSVDSGKAIKHASFTPQWILKSNE
jgi:predicted neuraminidase